MNSTDISNALRLVVGGFKVSDYSENGEQYEVHVRADLPFRSDPSVISQMTIPSLTQGNVALNQVVSFAEGSAPSQIVRLNRQRQVMVSSSVLPTASQQGIQDDLGPRHLRL